MWSYVAAIHDLKSVGIDDAKESGCSALKSRLDGLTEDELGLGVVSKIFKSLHWSQVVLG